MGMSAAGHAALYAIQRFHLEDFKVSQADIDRAQKEVYEFLKWKLGSATAVAAQFVSAGYQHFDRAYSDEAAAALLGAILPADPTGFNAFDHRNSAFSSGARSSLAKS